MRTSDKECSALSTICSMLGVNVSFLLTAKNGSTWFTSSSSLEYPDHWEASLADIETEDQVEIQTIINGKVIASKPIVTQRFQEIKIL